MEVGVVLMMVVILHLAILCVAFLETDLLAPPSACTPDNRGHTVLSAACDS